MTWSRGQLLLGLGVVLAVAAVIAGMMVAGTPAEGRARRLDDVRAGDLRKIMTAVDDFLKRQEHLPGSLSELVADPHTDVSLLDPDTKVEYEYRVLDEDSYELCAVFELASLPDTRTPGAFWLHDAGRNCFSLDATTKLDARIPGR